MPIQLPDLDDRTWEDLMEEGRSLIVAWAPQWTDHNASDTGITLLEMFAYLTEVLLYRANRIPDRHEWQFLRLINGPKWHCREDLEECIRQTLNRLPERHRSVSAEDVEALAERVPGVRKAWCLPNRNLLHLDASGEPAEAAGYVSVLIAPAADHAHRAHDLLHEVRETLEPTRLLGTRIHVRLPKYLSVRVRANLELLPGASPSEVHARAEEALLRFFDVEKGLSGAGWPLGRSVYVSEVYQQLQQVPGVRAVHKIIDPATRRPADLLAVDPGDAGRLTYNRLRELESVQVRPLELVRVSPDREMFQP